MVRLGGQGVCFEPGVSVERGAGEAQGADQSGKHRRDLGVSARLVGPLRSGDGGGKLRQLWELAAGDRVFGEGCGEVVGACGFLVAGEGLGYYGTEQGGPREADEVTTSHFGLVLSVSDEINGRRWTCWAGILPWDGCGGQVAGSEAESHARLVGHVQAVGDALEHLQGGDLLASLMMALTLPWL
ncbi:hypothetical protein Mame01_07280 [Microbispora amethystogenes]|nr:hypothetical protein Mame01_07280 [Microbispora amethystogenes]